MKKVFLSLFIIFAIFVFTLTNLKANTTVTVTITDGASIRTEGEYQGLRFSAVLSSMPDGATRGFLLARGEHTKDVMINAFEQNKLIEPTKNNVVNLEIEGTDLNIHGIIYDMNENDYITDFTAVAYVKVGTTYTYSDLAVTRNIKEIALDIKENDQEMYNSSPLISNVALTQKVTFDTNGGRIVTDKAILLNKVLSNDIYGYYTIFNTEASYGNKGNSYWGRLYLKMEQPGLYEIIGVTKAGDAYNAPTGTTHVISFHSNASSVLGYGVLNSMSQTTESIGKFVKFAEYDEQVETTDKLVHIYDNRIDALTSIYNMQGIREIITLPKAERDYYVFNGWVHASNLTEDPFTTLTYDVNNLNDVNLKAVFSPKQYTINYVLGDGKCSETLVTSYNYESSEIILPDETKLTLSGYNFDGWYDNPEFLGNKITSIPTNSYGDKTFYAKWVSNKIEITISENDIEIINSINPTKYVYNNLLAETCQFKNIDGQLVGEELTLNENIFANINQAITCAAPNDVIYIFSGTYATSNVVIGVEGLKIYGPNKGIKGTQTRNEEAIIKMQIKINANNVTLDGLKFIETGNILIGNANNTILDNLYVKAAAITVNGVNRKGVIAIGGANSNTLIQNSHLQTSSTGYLDCVISGSSTSTNLTVKNNNIFTEASGTKTYEAITLYHISGTLNILENTFKTSTSNWAIYVGVSSNTCSEINIKDNSFGAISTLGHSGINVNNLSATTVLNVIHNDFNKVGGNIFKFDPSTSGSKVNIMYNKYNDTAYKISNPGNATITYTNNYYSVPQTTSTSDYNVIKSLEELEAAYLAYLNGSN